MMNEKPIEWITTIPEKMMHRMARVVCLAFATAMILTFFLMIPSLITLVLFGVFLVCFLLLHFRALVEYEFTYFADELRVVAIYNQKRRRKKITVQLSEIQYMVKKIEPGEETIYCCERKDEGYAYTLALSKEGKRIHLIFQPDPAFIEVLQRRRLVR